MPATDSAGALLEAATALEPLVAQHADASERERRVAPPVVEALREAGVFHALVPRALGGLEIDVATLVSVIEALSRADGSTGWIAMIGASTALTSAYLAPEAATSIFGSRPGIIAAGVVAPRGTAAPEAGQYRISGRWPFASGCQHSDWIGLAAMAQAGDESTEARMCFLPMAAVDIIDTWSVSGLRATGSHDVEVHDVLVPGERTFSLAGDRPKHDGPLYGFSMMALLSVCVAAVALGIARGALDDFQLLAETKTPTGRQRTLASWSIAQAQYASAEAELRAGRAFLLECIDDMWRTLASGAPASREQRALVRLAATQATNGAVRAVDSVYNLGGGSSIYETSTLQRRFRDIHTLTQHVMVNTSSLEAAGRVLLGLDVPPGFL